MQEDQKRYGQVLRFSFALVAFILSFFGLLDIFAGIRKIELPYPEALAFLGGLYNRLFEPIFVTALRFMHFDNVSQSWLDFIAATCLAAISTRQIDRMLLGDFEDKMQRLEKEILLDAQKRGVDVYSFNVARLIYSLGSLPTSAHRADPVYAKSVLGNAYDEFKSKYSADGERLADVRRLLWWSGVEGRVNGLIAGGAGMLTLVLRQLPGP